MNRIGVVRFLRIIDYIQGISMNMHAKECSMYNDFFIDAATLVELIKAGSIYALAEATGEHRTTISRRIQRLEFHLKNNVINNRGGKIELTAYGIGLIPHLNTMTDQVSQSYSALINKSEANATQIRFFNNISIYYFFLESCLKSLLNIDRKLSIEMVSYSYYQMLNFGLISKALFDQFDIIFIHESLIHLINDQEWIMKIKLETIHKLYASQLYLKDHSSINSIKDLSQHVCIYAVEDRAPRVIPVGE